MLITAGACYDTLVWSIRTLRINLRIRMRIRIELNHIGLGWYGQVRLGWHIRQLSIRLRTQAKSGPIEVGQVRLEYQVSKHPPAQPPPYSAGFHQVGLSRFRSDWGIRPPHIQMRRETFEYYQFVYIFEHFQFFF